MKKIRDMSKEEKQIFSQRVQLYGGMLILVVSIALFLRWYNTNQIAEGIMPTPRKAVTPITVTYYAQDDPLWADDALGETGYTMGEEGSLFACLSMMLESNAEITVTPSQLNRQFMENGLYLDGKTANVTALDTLYPEISFSAPQDFSGENITNELRRGRTCMVRVMRGENVHWLLITGSDEETFFVLDPAQDSELRLLSDYEKVYALGIVK